MHNTKQVLICGYGHQGIAMSAHLAINGNEIFLWNRTRENIKNIIETKKIKCSGIVNGTASLSIISDNIEEVLTDVIMITTPSSAHKDIAKILAPYVHKDMVIVLNPGRTFGAVEFASTLQKNGAMEMPHIAETQTIIYTCRKSGINSATIYALKEDVKIAAIKGSDIEYIMSRIPECIRSYFSPVNSLLQTSLTNVGMVLHCSPVLMNIGWIETEKVDFKYYYDGISPSVARFLEKIDFERMAVAEAIGCPIESVSDWLKRTYKVTGNNLFECIRNNEKYREIDAPPTINCRYILEDVPNGLVPIEYLGKELDIPTPNISMIIDLACSVLNIDFRKTGRQYSKKIIENYI